MQLQLNISILMQVLSQEEIDGCHEAFQAFDKDHSGSIDVWELRQVLTLPC